jgi:hypothetical protein
MGGSKTKTLVDGQFACLYNGAALTLNGSTQAAIAYLHLLRRTRQHNGAWAPASSCRQRQTPPP